MIEIKEIKGVKITPPKWWAVVIIMLIIYWLLKGESQLIIGLMVMIVPKLLNR